MSHTSVSVLSDILLNEKHKVPENYVSGVIIFKCISCMWLYGLTFSQKKCKKIALSDKTIIWGDRTLLFLFYIFNYLNCIFYHMCMLLFLKIMCVYIYIYHYRVLENSYSLIKRNGPHSWYCLGKEYPKQFGPPLSFEFISAFIPPSIVKIRL